MRSAPASRLFSISSLTTEAGRSTTSPAAIWLTSWAGSWRMRMSHAADGSKKPAPAQGRSPIAQLSGMVST